MQKTMTALVALALLATVAPVAQADDYGARNLAWLMETFPEAADLPQETLDAFVERSERADIAAVISASGDSGTHVGDVWIIGFVSACPANNVIAPGHGQFVPVDTQLWLYPDPVQQITATGSLTVIGWTSKTSGFGTTADITGVTDNYCSFGFYFPFINGLVN